jgi:purine-nucleoside phosphorylase
MNPALEALRARAPHSRPRIAVVLGSGWGGVTEHVVDPIRVPYPELMGFPHAGVAGHSGELWLGRIGNNEVAIMSGRKHTYEDGDASAMRLPLATLQEMGCRVLVQTNASGSLRAGMGPGSLMVLSDHINMAQRSPLVGEPGSERFVDMVNAYDSALRRSALETAARLGTPLHEGVYMWLLGPQFETPAEIRMYAQLGADAVGMSTVPETIIARRIGMKVLALSLVTNMAAGMSAESLSHAHTLEQARLAGATASNLLANVIKELHV